MNHVLFAPHILKPGELFEERQFNRAGGAVALFADYQFGLSLVVIRRTVELFAIDEADNIAVLFDRAALPQIAELRLVFAALLGRARKLRQSDDRNVQLLRED